MGGRGIQKLQQIKKPYIFGLVPVTLQFILHDRFQLGFGGGGNRLCLKYLYSSAFWHVDVLEDCTETPFSSPTKDLSSQEDRLK